LNQPWEGPKVASEPAEASIEGIFCHQEPIELLSPSNFPNLDQSCRTIGRLSDFEILA
jgi:hypothetical protein